MKYAFVAATAIALFQGVGALALYRRRPESEYASFAAMAFSLAGLVAATALGEAMTTPFQSAILQRIEQLFGVCGFVSFAHFAIDVLETDPRRVALKRASRVVFVVHLVVNFTGGLVDPAQSVLGQWPVASRTVAAHVLDVVSVSLVVWIAVELFRDRRATGVRVIATGTAMLLPSWIHDIVVQTGGGRPPRFVEVSGILSLTIFSFLLLKRFVAAGDLLESQREQLNESMRQLSATEQEILEKERLAAIGEVSAIIAREMRDPLTVLRNAVTGLRKEKDTEAQGELLTALDRETSRLNELIGDLRSYAQVIDPHQRAASLGDILNRALEAAAELSPFAEVRVEREEDPNVALFVDHRLIEEAFTTLLKISAHAAPTGTLRIESEEIGDDALVRFIDDGRSGRERPMGTWLGHAIVARVALAHGGDMDVEDGVTRTQVTLRLPLAPTVDQEPKPNDIDRANT